MGLKIASQSINFLGFIEKLILWAANSKAKKTSEQTFAHNRLVEHHLLDMKMILDISLAPLVASNKALKL